MDKADEGTDARQLTLDLVVPPLRTRVEPWEYGREIYNRRSEVERLFRRLKGFRRIFSRFDKVDVMFIVVFNFALIVENLQNYEHVLREMTKSGVQSVFSKLTTSPTCSLWRVPACRRDALFVVREGKVRVQVTASVAPGTSADFT